jgi:hypothetical protein
MLHTSLHIYAGTFKYLCQALDLIIRYLKGIGRQQAALLADAQAASYL